MPACKICGEIVSAIDINENGVCKICIDPDIAEKMAQEKEKQQLELQDRIECERSLAANRFMIHNNVLVTTETVINQTIEERHGLVFAQRVFGMNIVKDFFSGVRDIVGGRVGNIEKAIDSANIEIISEFKDKAYLMGGNAVVGISFNYDVTGSVISIVASGTVLRIK